MSVDDSITGPLLFHQLVQYNTVLEGENALLRRAISEKDHLLTLAAEVLQELNELNGG